MTDKTDLLLDLAEPLASVLMRCQTVLHNMALENEPGLARTFNRWLISHEPLRSDAKNLLPVISEALSTYHKAFMDLEKQGTDTLSSQQRATGE